MSLDLAAVLLLLFTLLRYTLLLTLYSLNIFAIASVTFDLLSLLIAMQTAGITDLINPRFYSKYLSLLASEFCLSGPCYRRDNLNTYCKYYAGGRVGRLASRFS